MPYDGKGKTPLGINFGTSASIILKTKVEHYVGGFSCLRYYEIDEVGVPYSFPCENERLKEVAIVKFQMVPGCPLVYWLSDDVFNTFSIFERVGSYARAAKGLVTANNDVFVRDWSEVCIDKIGFGCATRVQAQDLGAKWFPYAKGGVFRRWYGNFESVVNWENDGSLIQNTLTEDGLRVRATNFNLERIFRDGISWTVVTSGKQSFRYLPAGFLFDAAAGICQSTNGDNNLLLGYLNSKLSSLYLGSINPTLNLHPGYLECIPFHIPATCDLILDVVKNCLSLQRNDWDSHEVSWHFTRFSLLQNECLQELLTNSYQYLRSSWHSATCEMLRLEEENNRLFINAYGLQDELTPEVPLSEITLTCNPHYRYGGNLSDEEREARLQSDTIVELISYAIGCMMGRYSLDREGLVYAHAGNEGFKALVEEGAYATFAADEDGILPLSNDSWFEDDVATRLEAFVCTVWGTETLEENLQFIADSLCLSAIKPVKKGGETARETLRRYLSTQFYKDHLKTYKKRPIYWLFSSGKEKAFECLVYLHRYNEATLPRMRTEYVTPLLGQMASRIERKRLEQTEAGTAEAKRIGKEIDNLTKQLTELRAFDDELKHHADMRITLDLDDGVKVNYGKFGTLLSDVKAITGDKGE